jgi:hypothetical protein
MIITALRLPVRSLRNFGDERECRVRSMSVSCPISLRDRLAVQPSWATMSAQMSHRPNRDDWMRNVAETQRNLVFPDTTRNMGGFWRGIHKQKLNLAQSVGFLVLFVFYLALFVGLVVENWPLGSAPFWQKVFSGYGPYFLLSLPLILFFLLMHWRIRRSNSHSKPRNTLD